MIHLYCSDLRHIHPFECCQTCHNDEEDGYSDLPWTETRRIDGQEVFLEACCSAPVDPLTDDDFRRMIAKQEEPQ